MSSVVARQSYVPPQPAASQPPVRICCCSPAPPPPPSVPFRSSNNNKADSAAAAAPVSTSGRQRQRCSTPLWPAESTLSLARGRWAATAGETGARGWAGSVRPSARRPSSVDRAFVSPTAEKRKGRRNGGFVVCLGPVTRRIVRSKGCYYLCNSICCRNHG